MRTRKSWILLQKELSTRYFIIQQLNCVRHGESTDSTDSATKIGIIRDLFRNWNSKEIQRKNKVAH